VLALGLVGGSLALVQEAAAFSCGGASCCGLVEGSAEVICWGEDNGHTSAATRGLQFYSIHVTEFAVCGIRMPSRKLHCWGDASRANFLLTGIPDVPVSTMDLGSQHGCALRADDGRALCWGEDNAWRNEGFDPLQDVAFSAIAVGEGHTCGIRADSEEAACWGADFWKQCSASPKGVALSSIYARSQGSCGIDKSSLRIRCWGLLSRTPDGTRSAALSFNLTRSCALNISSTAAICWGPDNDGPKPPEGVPLAALAVVNYGVCAIRRDTRRPECWGALLLAVSAPTVKLLVLPPWPKVEQRWPALWSRTSTTSTDPGDSILSIGGTSSTATPRATTKSPEAATTSAEVASTRPGAGTTIASISSTFGNASLGDDVRTQVGTTTTTTTTTAPTPGLPPVTQQGAEEEPATTASPTEEGLNMTAVIGSGVGVSAILAIGCFLYFRMRGGARQSDFLSIKSKRKHYFADEIVWVRSHEVDPWMQGVVVDPDRMLVRLKGCGPGAIPTAWKYVRRAESEEHSQMQRHRRRRGIQSSPTNLTCVSTIASSRYSDGDVDDTPRGSDFGGGKGGKGYWGKGDSKGTSYPMSQWAQLGVPGGAPPWYNSKFSEQTGKGSPPSWQPAGGSSDSYLSVDPDVPLPLRDNNILADQMLDFLAADTGGTAAPGASWEASTRPGGDGSAAPGEKRRLPAHRAARPSALANE